MVSPWEKKEVESGHNVARRIKLVLLHTPRNCNNLPGNVIRMVKL